MQPQAIRTLPPCFVAGLVTRDPRFTILISAVCEVGEVYPGVSYGQSVLNVLVTSAQTVIYFVCLERVNCAVRMLFNDITPVKTGYLHIYTFNLVTSESFVGTDLSAAPALAHG